jgi:hypothetical protein
MSVQPMNLPSGLVFFLDFQYGANSKNAPVGPFGPGGDTYGATSSMYGNTNPGVNSDPSNGLYGAGRFAYSINQFSASFTAVATTASWADVDYAAELSASIFTNQFTKVAVTASSLTRPDLKGVRAFVMTSGSVVTPTIQAKVLPQYTTTDGQFIYFIFTGSVNTANVPLNGGTNWIWYNQQPVDNNRGDFEDNSGAGYVNAESTTADQLAIPQINIQMKSEAIVAKTRKLKAQWTPEFAQDLNAYQSLDAEAEFLQYTRSVVPNFGN